MTSPQNGRNRKETRMDIKAQFGKFKDSDIKLLKGHMDELSCKGQKAYENDKANSQIESTAVVTALMGNQGGIPAPS